MGEQVKRAILAVLEYCDTDWAVDTISRELGIDSDAAEALLELVRAKFKEEPR